MAHLPVPTDVAAIVPTLFTEQMGQTVAGPSSRRVVSVDGRTYDVWCALDRDGGPGLGIHLLIQVVKVS